jgi:hypothetical protein
VRRIWTIAVRRRQPEAPARAKPQFDGYPIRVDKESPVSFKDIFDLYRHYLIHQYDLLNHRTNWFIGINAFLLTTYGFTIQKKLEVTRSIARVPDGFPDALISANNFLIIISLFGAALSVLAFLLLRAAIWPIDDLHKLFNKFAEQFGEAESGAGEPRTVAYMPYIVGGLSDKTYGPTFTMCIPALLLATWLAISVLTIDPHLLPEIRAWVLKALF